MKFDWLFDDLHLVVFADIAPFHHEVNMGPGRQDSFHTAFAYLVLFVGSGSCPSLQLKCETWGRRKEMLSQRGACQKAILKAVSIFPQLRFVSL
jgi:hypothetical protein